MTTAAAGTGRTRRLRALGVTPYGLRGNPRASAGETPADGEAAAGPGPGVPAAHAHCVLVLPASSSPRQLDLVGRAMHALGADFARAPRVQVGPDGIGEAPPSAAAYLAFGQAQARALGHVLPGEVMRAAEVVLLDTPGDLFGGEAKRRLWLALKALRRRPREH